MPLAPCKGLSNQHERGYQQDKIATTTSKMIPPPSYFQLPLRATRLARKGQAALPERASPRRRRARLPRPGSLSSSPKAANERLARRGRRGRLGVGEGACFFSENRVYDKKGRKWLQEAATEGVKGVEAALRGSEP